MLSEVPPPRKLTYVVKDASTVLVSKQVMLNGNLTEEVAGTPVSKVLEIPGTAELTDLRQVKFVGGYMILRGGGISAARDIAAAVVLAGRPTITGYLSSQEGCLMRTAWVNDVDATPDVVCNYTIHPANRMMPCLLPRDDVTSRYEVTIALSGNAGAAALASVDYSLIFHLMAPAKGRRYGMLTRESL